MNPETTSVHGLVYQLKVHLIGVSPMVWRRLLVANTTTIAQLHYIVQIAMGWEGYHLHRFMIYGKDYGISYAGGMGFTDDPNLVELSDFRFRIDDTFLYEYDFGDSWEHQIRVEKTLQCDPKKAYPRCIDGKRACPPEDSGGPWAYQEALHLLKRRWHPERRFVVERLGKDFDPKVFCRGPVNQAFRDKEHDPHRKDEQST